MTEIHSYLGVEIQLWKCRECGHEFGWYTAMSGLKRPSECGWCGQNNQFHLIRLTPKQERELGYSRGN